MADFKKEFFNLVNAAGSILITTHKDPDGDAVASLLAVYTIIKESFSDKAVRVMISSPVSFRFASFANFGKIESVDDIANYLDQFDLAVFVDGNYDQRFTNDPEKFRQFAGKRIFIDHHPDKIEKFDLKYMDENASSTSELIYFLLVDQDRKVSKALAESLLMGLLSDTGNLRYVGHHEGQVFLMAKKLVEDGEINVDELTARFSTYSTPVFQVLREFIKNTQIEEIAGWPKFLYSHITPQFADENKFTVLETEEAAGIYTDFLRALEEAPWGFVARNYNDIVKVSFRSRAGSVNVRDVAEGLKRGSGHMHSAGAKFAHASGQPFSVAEALDEIKDWLKNNTATFAD